MFSICSNNTWLTEETLSQLSEELITSFWLSQSDLHGVIKVEYSEFFSLELIFNQLLYCRPPSTMSDILYSDNNI